MSYANLPADRVYNSCKKYLDKRDAKLKADQELIIQNHLNKKSFLDCIFKRPTREEYHWVREMENLMALSKLAMGGTVEVSDDVAFMVLENWEK